MKLKARCPNDENHKEFVTTAVVTEEWTVDSNGYFLTVFEDGETIHGPSIENIWTCLECDAVAEVEYE